MQDIDDVYHYLEAHRHIFRLPAADSKYVRDRMRHINREVARPGALTSKQREMLQLIISKKMLLWDALMVLCGMPPAFRRAISHM